MYGGAGELSKHCFIKVETMAFGRKSSTFPCYQTIKRGFQDSDNHGITWLKNNKNVPKCEFQQRPWPWDKCNAVGHQGRAVAKQPGAKGVLTHSRAWCSTEQHTFKEKTQHRGQEYRPRGCLSHTLCNLGQVQQPTSYTRPSGTHLSMKNWTGGL